MCEQQAARAPAGKQALHHTGACSMCLHQHVRTAQVDLLDEVFGGQVDAGCCQLRKQRPLDAPIWRRLRHFHLALLHLRGLQDAAGAAVQAPE